MVITLNLVVWLPLLTLVAVLRLVAPAGPVIAFCERATERIYRSAVRVDTYWLRHVLGMQMKVEGTLGDARSAVVLSNHRSWFDILVLQWLITFDGPIVKFLVKKELIWVPVIGWICLAMNFPRLHRSTDVAEREQDYEAIRQASEELRGAKGMLLAFAEGTRFSEEKRIAQASPYRHLLRPKLGGLRIMKENLPADTPVVDVTIAYPPEARDLWRCLSGAVKQVSVKVQRFSLREIDDLGAWLDARWREKDRWLGVMQRTG